MISRIKNILLVTAIVSASFGAVSAWAQQAEVSSGMGDVIPAMGMASPNHAEPADEDMTHPTLYLTPDRSEIVELNEPVGSIIVGNPNHVNVLADNANRLVFVPRMQGATYITVIGQNDKVIMQRHVIVGGQRKNYLRIRRGCTAENCQPTSVYYCPDNCHEIYTDTESAGANAESSAQANQQAVDAAEKSAASGEKGNAESEGTIE